MEYSERQNIERDCFNKIVHEKWDGKSLLIDKYIPPFGEYSGDLLDRAHLFLGDVSGKKILEIGCGNGELSVWFVKNGAEVWGVDISDESIKIAERRSKENSTGEKTHFLAQAAEQVPFEDNFFDVIFINVSLHHLIIDIALKEFHRVARKGGLLVAIEPLVFSKTIQKIRTSRLFTKLYPIYQETLCERILTKEDIAIIKKIFSNVFYVPCRVFSPFIFKIKPVFRLISKIFFYSEKNLELRYQKLNRLLQKIDALLLRIFPFMRFLSRYVVIKGQKM